MCGIAGYCSLEENFLQTKAKQEKQVSDMGKTIVHRGPDDFGIYVGETCGICPYKACGH